MKTLCAPSAPVTVRATVVGVAVMVAAMLAALLGLASVSGAEPYAEVVVPDRIEAEHYDDGVNGEAFFDTDIFEGRGQFRAENPVDTFIIDNSGASGGVLLGRTRDGEFTRYTINVDTADEFEIRLSLASGHPEPGVIHVDVDGERVGSVDGGTNRWFDWTTRSAGSIALEPGSHVVQLTWDEGAQINLDWLEVVSTTPTAAQCPGGTLEAEDAELSGRFEVGESPSASGGAYAAVPRGSGGWWNGISDSYVEFCAAVDTAGEYRIDARVFAASAKKRSFFVSVDNGPLVDFVAQTDTGLFQTTAVNDAGALDPLRAGDADAEIVDPVLWDLEPGDHTIRFYLRRDGARLDTVTLVPASEPTAPEPESCRDCEALRDLLDAANITPPVGEPCDWTRFGDSNVTVACSDESPPTIIKLFLRNRLTEVPPEVGNLTNLEQLDVSDNALTSLPPEIGNLTNLLYLSARNNQITSLPSEIGDLADLIYLDLYTNNLTGLPPELANLTNLRTLGLYDNDLSVVPPEIASMTSLTRLSLSNNELTEVPTFIGSLTNLVDLGLGSNDLTELPPELGNLTNLGRFGLGVSYNDLTEIPAWVVNFTGLERLNIQGNRIAVLEPEVVAGLATMPNLTAIDLSSNLVRELPAEMGELTNLTYLDLRQNSLRGDITVLAPLVDTWVLVTDGPGRNNCLTTTDADLADRLSTGWDLCEDRTP